MVPAARRRRACSGRTADRRPSRSIATGRTSREIEIHRARKRPWRPPMWLPSSVRRSGFAQSWGVLLAPVVAIFDATQKVRKSRWFRQHHLPNWGQSPFSDGRGILKSTLTPIRMQLGCTGRSVLFLTPIRMQLGCTGRSVLFANARKKPPGSREPGGRVQAYLPCLRSMRQRIRAQLQLHQLRHVALADAFAMERRAVAGARPHAAALPAAVGIIDAAVDELGE